MSLKWQREDSCKHKLELLTMQALKFGKTNHTIQRVIYGVLVAFYMKCAHSILLSEPMTCKVYPERFYPVFILLFLLLTQRPLKQTFYFLNSFSLKMPAAALARRISAAPFLSQSRAPVRAPCNTRWWGCGVNGVAFLVVAGECQRASECGQRGWFLFYGCFSVAGPFRGSMAWYFPRPSSKS